MAAGAVGGTPGPDCSHSSQVKGSPCHLCPPGPCVCDPAAHAPAGGLRRSLCGAVGALAAPSENAETRGACELSLAAGCWVLGSKWFHHDCTTLLHSSDERHRRLGDMASGRGDLTRKQLSGAPGRVLVPRRRMLPPRQCGSKQPWMGGARGVWDTGQQCGQRGKLPATSAEQRFTFTDFKNMTFSLEH